MNPEFDSRIREALTQALATGYLDEGTSADAAGFLVSGSFAPVRNDSPVLAPGTERILYQTAWLIYWGSKSLDHYMVPFNLGNLETSLHEYEKAHTPTR